MTIVSCHPEWSAKRGVEGSLQRFFATLRMTSILLSALLLVVSISACGNKGKLKSPAQIERQEQKKAREEQKKKEQEAPISDQPPQAEPAQPATTPSATE